VGYRETRILVEGEKLIGEALRAGLKPESLWLDGPSSFDPGCPLFQVPSQMYRAASPTRSGQAPLAVFPAPTFADASALTAGRYLLLDSVQEPGNAGALVRAAAAFQLDGVLWCQPCVYPYHHACIRASAGSVFHIAQYLFDPETSIGLPLIGTGTKAASNLDTYQWPEHFILVLGNEGHGLRETLNNRLADSVHIPTSTAVESLNVAGAAHILLYQMTRHHPHQQPR